MVSYSPLTSRLLSEAASIDWQSIDAAAVGAMPLLAQLAQTAVLRELVHHLATHTEHWAKCEREYGLTKFVLHADEHFRLRLHVMKLATQETPHSHRMNFVTRLLRGGYVQRLFLPEDTGVHLWPAGEIRCVVRQGLGADDAYALGHTIVHSLEVVSEPCISLMIRGPIVKERALNIDLQAGKVWWQRGEQHPAHETSRKLDMTSEIPQLLGLLESEGLI